MCGIVGYVGDRDITSVLLVGLERLSYRGYDSSGIAIVGNGELSYWKRAGKLHELSKALDGLTIKGELGIGHTRWATHGVPDEINAHPHLSDTKKIALVHNGIIENFEEIKYRLVKEGYIFRSQTDTEVLIHLIESHSKGLSLEAAVEKSLAEVVGTYAIAVIAESDPHKIVVVRKGSPLILGVGKHENYISSDLNAIVAHTKEVIFLEDNELGIVTRDEIRVKQVGGAFIDKKVETIVWNSQAAEKSGYDHFMLKEIYEQPSVLRRILNEYVVDQKVVFKHLKRTDFGLKDVNRFIIQACGTSWHAGLLGKYLIEKYANILTEVDISSEFRYRQIISQDNSVVVAISQSGETADTLACIREAKSKFFRILSFVNVKNSSIDRESDGVIYSHSGQEVGVASTKNYISQLVCMYLFSMHMASLKSLISPEELSLKLSDLARIPGYLESVLAQAPAIKKIAEKYAKNREFLFIGRSVNYPSALEGALKLKEISYIHATGYAAGELKHGPIALIDSNLPVVCIAPFSDTYDKMYSNIQEVKSRKGRTIIIATEGDTKLAAYADDIIYIPKVPEELSPILVAVPLQLLSYYIALNLDCDVDQPRNLAKSVTVE